MSTVKVFHDYQQDRARIGANERKRILMHAYLRLTHITRGISSNFLSRLRSNAGLPAVVSRLVAQKLLRKLKARRRFFSRLSLSLRFYLACGERRWDLWTVEFAANEARRRWRFSTAASKASSRISNRSHVRKHLCPGRTESVIW